MTGLACCYSRRKRVKYSFLEISIMLQALSENQVKNMKKSWFSPNYSLNCVGYNTLFVNH